MRQTFKKLHLSYFLIPLLLVAGYFVMHLTMPVYSGQYLFLVALILADLYLWSSVKKQVFNYRNWLRICIIFLYWLPLILLAVLLVGATLVPLIDWSNGFRTYLLGFMLVFYTAKILPILFLLLADFVRIIDRVFTLSKKENRQDIKDDNASEGITRSRFLQYMGFISGGLLMSTMFIGMFKWVYQFRVVREIIKLPNLPDQFRGFKVVQISDMHLGSWSSEKPLENAVELINNLNADLVVFTGDLVNFATKEAFDFGDTLAKIKAKHGVYTILGNHDYGNYVSWPTEEAKQENMDQLFGFYQKIGWKLLLNEHVIINKGDDSMALLGVENWGHNPRFPQLGDIDKAMAGAEKAGFRVLLTHDPSHWEKIVVPGNYPVDLSLSGHTHGFQFGIETKDIKWSPAQYMYKFWAGLYQDSTNPRYLYVNRGLGSIGYPGRIGMLPEITVIEFEKS
ncbi:MAG: metallophosphatase [Bacteroidetes bacterium CG18_big_fil_WC_8_21_14_2_50_41_14]|nr:MAG: metallophosphatase [Bacteroidetes bacterium CG18_big_fil_WC_8_21_14_2_50_41_14]